MAAAAKMNPTTVRRQRMLEVVQEDALDPDAAYYFAAWLAGNGSTREALDTLHKLTGKHPDYPGIWLFKATLYESLGDRKMADLCRARAERASPPSPTRVPAKPAVPSTAAPAKAPPKAAANGPKGKNGRGGRPAARKVAKRIAVIR